MNQDFELRLHIATPNGIAFNELIQSAQIKMHDGYMGINRNQLPTIQIVQIGLMTIRFLNGTTKEYLLGPGTMLIDQYYAQVYSEFLIDPDHIDDNEFLIGHQQIEQKLFDQKLQGIFDYKTELVLRQEIAKLRKQ
ncbi:F0F1 ATP synthase, F1 complex subunit epsilon, N-terminal domain-containing protein [[Mycoplasma] cavipharyngis]|uniref:hypothetical protein n=1 Tax=[Mycoplasma] cavipharyngis TaxID=92757 RepID=UPI00370384F8